MFVHNHIISSPGGRHYARIAWQKILSFPKLFQLTAWSPARKKSSFCRFSPLATRKNVKFCQAPQTVSRPPGTVSRYSICHPGGCLSAGWRQCRLDFIQKISSFIKFSHVPAVASRRKGPTLQHEAVALRWISGRPGTPTPEKR